MKARGHHRPTGTPVVPPIVLASTFQFGSTRELIAASHDPEANFYSRYGNPTVRAAEARVAELEGAERTLAFASGMAAIASVMLGTLRAGDRILAQAALYGGAQTLMQEWLPKYGIETDFVEPEALTRDFAAQLRPRHKLLHLETPINPLVQLVDIRALAKQAKKAGLKVMVDATFATPLLQKTLALGADYAMHSVTKGLGGHGDILGGVVSGSRRALEPVYRARKFLGGTMDPMTAYLLWRGIESLAARLERQQASATKLAKFLRGSRGIKRVNFPGLPDYPQKALWRRQMRGPGTMIAFDCGRPLNQTARCVDRLRVIRNAPSLGGSESLVSLPALTSHVGYAPAVRAALGITDGLVRLSVGLEEPADLIADLKRAFSL